MAVLFEWMDNRWLIIERDANNVYTKAKMRQCNLPPSLVADDGSIVERWCIYVEDDKISDREYSDNDFIITRGDSRIALIIAKTDTIRLNRDDRFLIDDYASPNVLLAYRLSKTIQAGRRL